MAIRESVNKLKNWEALSPDEFTELKAWSDTTPGIKPLLNTLKTGERALTADEVVTLRSAIDGASVGTADTARIANEAAAPRKRSKIASVLSGEASAGDFIDKALDVNQDVLATGLKAAGSLTKNIGAIPGLIGLGFDNPVTRFGQRVAEEGRYGQSEFLNEQEANLAAEQEKAKDQGILSEIYHGVKGRIENPATLAEGIAGAGSYIAPMMAPAKAVAGLAGLAKASPAAGRVAAITAAMLTGSGLQGASVGQETYEQIKEIPPDVLAQSEEWNALRKDSASDEEATQKLANKYGVITGNAGAAASMIFQLIAPGTELAMAGVKRKVAKNATKGLRQKITKTLIKEGIEQAGEIGEEVSGTMLTNYGVGQGDESRGLTEGVGETIVATAAATPFVSVAPSIREGFGIEDNATPSKSASKADGTANPPKEFARTRGARPAPRSEALTNLANDVSVSVPQEEVTSTEGQFNEQVSPVPADVQGELQGAPEGEVAPVAEAVPQAVATEDAVAGAEPVAGTDEGVGAPDTPPVSSDVADGGGVDAVASDPSAVAVPLPGISDQDALAKVSTLSTEEAKALLGARPLDGSLVGPEKTARNRLVSAIDRHIRYKEADAKKDAASPGGKKRSSSADSEINKTKRRIKDYALNGENALANEMSRKIRPLYDTVYGEDAQKFYDADMRIIVNAVAEKNTRAKEKAARSESNRRKKSAKGSTEVASIADAKTRASTIEEALKNAAANGEEALADAVEVYRKPLAELNTMLEPEGTKGSDRTDAFINELHNSVVPAAPVAPPVAEAQPAPVAPVAPVAPAVPEPRAKTPPPAPRTKKPIASAATVAPVKIRLRELGTEALRSIYNKGNFGTKIKIVSGQIHAQLEGSSRPMKIDFPTTSDFMTSAEAWYNFFTTPGVAADITGRLISIPKGDPRYEASRGIVKKIETIASDLMDEKGVEHENLLDFFEESPYRYEQERKNLAKNPITIDDVKIIESLYQGKNDAVLNEASTLVVGLMLGAISGLAVGAYKGGRLTGKALQTAIDKSREAMRKVVASDWYQKTATTSLPPEGAFQGFARAILNNPATSDIRASAVRALSNRINDFTTYVHENSLKLFNLYDEAAKVDFDQRDEHAPKYREWIESEGANEDSEVFQSLPDDVKVAFRNFKAITDHLGTESASLDGSVRSNYVPRIIDQRTAHAVRAMASSILGRSRMLNEDKSTRPVNNLRESHLDSWASAVALIPEGSPLAEQHMHAVDGREGILHGFLNEAGEFAPDLDKLPGYLKHEVKQDIDKDPPKHLFPALMEYVASEPDGTNITYTAKIKDLSKSDPDAIRSAVEAEALRMMAEMFDFEYAGGRSAAFGSKKQRNRAYRTDGALINGRELPYLGEGAYVSDPWIYMPQVIHRQVRGLSRWKFFGKNREQLNAFMHAIGPLDEVASPDGYDRRMGVRFPKNGSVNLEWNPETHTGTLAGVLDDIAMGYYSAKPPFGTEPISLIRPDGSYDFGSRTYEQFHNAITKKNIEAASNFLMGAASMMMLMFKSIVTMTNETGGAAGAGLQGVVKDYMVNRAKVTPEKRLKGAKRKGMTDASTRAPTTRLEERALNAARWLGTFRESVERMDAGARMTGNAAFREALRLYADAQDLGWDENAVSTPQGREAMLRAKRLRQDMELMYSPTELAKAIQLFDKLDPAMDEELDRYAFKFSREMSKSISGLSDNSAKSGLNRYWMFSKSSAGFFTGITLAMQMQQIRDLFRVGSLTGRSRKERIKGYLAGAATGGALLTASKANPLTSTLLSSIVTSNYKPLIPRGLLVAAMLGGGLTPFHNYSSESATIQLQHGTSAAQRLSDGDPMGAIAGAGWLTSMALKGMPLPILADKLGYTTPISAADRKASGLREMPSSPLDLAELIPIIGFPIDQINILMKGGGLGVEALGELASGNVDVAKQKTFQGLFTLGKTGGIFSSEIGYGTNTGKIETDPKDRTDNLINVMSEPAMPSAYESKAKQIRSKIPR